MDIAPNAKICRDFALLGYCDKGARCDKRHVFECPDFEATGKCPRKKCVLKHTIRATHPSTPSEATTDQANTPMDANLIFDGLDSWSSDNVSDDGNHDTDVSEEDFIPL
jgi:hypothetical protein